MCVCVIREKLLLRAQYTEYCDGDRIIILAQTRCFGQIKKYRHSHSNSACGLGHSFTSVPLSHKTKKDVLCPVLVKIWGWGGGEKQESTLTVSISSSTFARLRLV